MEALFHVITLKMFDGSFHFSHYKFLLALYSFCHICPTASIALSHVPQPNSFQWAGYSVEQCHVGALSRHQTLEKLGF